ncbi:reverse transcriptase domain-containing protein [Tanacetum coccineum]
MTPLHFNTYQSSYNNSQLQQQFSPSQFGSIHPNQHYSSTYPSQPQFNHSSVPSSYPYQSQMNHQISYVPQIAYQSPQVTTQPMTESPLMDSSFAVLVFSPGDDPIACLHKAMAFLTAVAINPDYPEQTIMIGSTLTKEGQNKLCDLLQRFHPVRQNRRSQAANRNHAIQEEVEKLVDADFKDLNKACPKDSYPLPGIDWKCIKKSDFHWTKEAEATFKQMKQLIAELPTLTAPEEKEELIVYLAAAKEAISVVFMTEREAKQMPIYFISRALRGPKVNYTSMEKLVLALVHANKHLKRYFKAHPIIVVTDQPIKQVLSKLEVAGRLQKQSIELGEYAIHYRPRVSVKGQILADFIVERPEEDDPDTTMEVEELPEPCILFTDGFKATNNEAEYEALIAGLRIAEEMGVKNL